MPDPIAKAIEAELLELADAFEGAGPDAVWTGKDIARALRHRVAYRADEPKSEAD